MKLYICFLGVLHVSSNVFLTALAGAWYLIICSTFFGNEILYITSLYSWVADMWDRPHVSPHVSDPTTEANFWVVTVWRDMDHFEAKP
jgi:hypothetical protein